MEHLARQEASPTSNATAKRDEESRSITSVSPEVITIDLSNSSPPPSSGNDRKRAKTNETGLNYRMNYRRTKKDYRQELELMNAASDKILSLNSENARLRLLLEKAQAENTTLQLALDQERLAFERERRLSMDRESSNRTLRLMLLEERVRAETRAKDSRLYPGVSMAPPSLPTHVLPISRPRDAIEDFRLSTARGMHAPVVSHTRIPPREGISRSDAPKPSNEQTFHSQLTAQRVRSELASVVEKSSE